jgi:hypothetical protein
MVHTHCGCLLTSLVGRGRVFLIDSLCLFYTEKEASENSVIVCQQTYHIPNSLALKKLYGSSCTDSRDSTPPPSYHVVEPKTLYN